MSSKRDTKSPNKSYRSQKSGAADGKVRYPLRRELVKRFISYYQLLEEEEVGMNKPPQSMNTEENYQAFRHDLNHWDNKLAHAAKCEELKALMKVELQTVYDGEKLDDDEEDYNRATGGYPSFMKAMDADELERVAIAPNMNTTYSVMAGPAMWRKEYTQILENLIEGRESQADLDKMNNILFTIYYKKQPKDEYDAIGHDFHKRMAKEIRRRQYDIQIREKSRSRSPKRRPQGVIIEPVPEHLQTKEGMKDLLTAFATTGLTDYYSPNTERPKANVTITDKDDWPKESDFSKVDTDRKYNPDEDPASATHTGTGVPVRVQRAPNAEDLTEEDLYEELLNERWQRRVRAVKGKIKNFLTEDGVTKDMVEVCTDAEGADYFRPITGNLKRKNHPNVIPSVFLMMEE